MKKLFGIFLGVLTAIGGFVDIGDLVANSETGARFGMSLAWVVILGVIGIVVYAEMAGRVAAESGRPVFDLVRERLGPRMALVNLGASFFINFLTLAAELAGVAIALSLLAGISYVLLIPAAAFLVWVVIWRMPFEAMERLFGLLGLCLLVFVVTVFHAAPDWGSLAHQALHPVLPSKETPFTYAYFGIALFGAAMTPYEVFFFSSGAVEEHWSDSDLKTERANVLIGFPLGGLLSLAIMVGTTIVFRPLGISVDTLPQVALPTAVVLGKAGLAVLLLGIFAATFGAALETGLSAGYTVAQYLGWQWGKFVRPREAPRFHLVVIVSIVAGALFLFSGVDPVKVTEYSIVLSAAALPLTYFPILVIANDPGRLWATLSLLDRQLVDRDGRLAGKVDDVELGETSEGTLVVTGLRAGPGALARRMGARVLGDWLDRAHRGVEGDGSDHTLIPLARVADIGATIRLSLDRSEVATYHNERWVHDHVIAHIPGAAHEAE